MTDPSISSASPSRFALLGRLVDDGVDHGEGVVVVDDGKIAAVETAGTAGASALLANLPPRRFRAAIISPGFIDLQVNGGFGFEVDEDSTALLGLARRLPETGVTSCLPTLVSRNESRYAAAFAALAAAHRVGTNLAGGHVPGQASTRMFGFHLEGPLLSARRAGAHDLAAIEAASTASVGRILRSAEDQAVRICLLTLAPEREDALTLIGSLRRRGIAVSVGHTDASHAITLRGIGAGAHLATHVFNAMAPLHHREPGTVTAVLADDRVTAFFIADGVHVHPAVLALALRAKPAGRRAIVTDAIAAAGLDHRESPGETLRTKARSGAREGEPSGENREPAETRARELSRLAGKPVHVVPGTESALPPSARLADGTLAGSLLTMDRAVRNCVELAGMSPAEALQMATAVPAAAIGCTDRGRLRVGDPADLVSLNAELEVLATWVGGVLAFADEDTARALRA